MSGGFARELARDDAAEAERILAGLRPDGGEDLGDAGAGSWPPADGFAGLAGGQVIDGEQVPAPLAPASSWPASLAPAAAGSGVVAVLSPEWELVDLPPVRRGGRFVGAVMLLLTAVATLAGNIGYTALVAGQSSALSVGLSVLWPLLMFGGLEYVLRSYWRRGWRTKVLLWFGVGPLVGLAGWTSYQHQSAVLTHLGQGEVTSFFGPLIIDGLLLLVYHGRAHTLRLRRRTTG